MQQLWSWCNAHPLASYFIASALVTSLWYSIRGAMWPGRKTSALPGAARLVQALVEFLSNAPGVVKVARGDDSPPGSSSSPRIPPPPAVPVLALAALALLVPGLAACPPRPQPTVDGSVTPSAWTDTARVILNTTRWALPAARAVVGALVEEPGRTTVLRSLDAAADWSGRLERALQVYEARGGDRCAAHAAAGGLTAALVDLARVLADNGLALGRPLELLVDAAGGLVDTLVPACQQDAGFASAGDAANRELANIADRAASRGVTLRRDLDSLRPADGSSGR